MSTEAERIEELLQDVDLRAGEIARKLNATHPANVQRTLITMVDRGILRIARTEPAQKTGGGRRVNVYGLARKNWLQEILVIPWRGARARHQDLSP